MAYALVALGSNLGSRAQTLDAALDELAQLPSTRLIRRSGWYETPPIGGPAAQGAFLNGAALMWTTLSPRSMLAALQQIEAKLGRVRAERWGARVIDLDLLLFDHCVIDESDFVAPHPRMAFRPFVLEPAAEAAPWMVDPTCGWTLQAMSAQLREGANVVAIAAESESRTEQWISRLAAELGLSTTGNRPTGGDSPCVAPWNEYRQRPAAIRPRLILAFTGETTEAAPARAAGNTANPWRTMLHLPQHGPIAWISSHSGVAPFTEASAAIQAVWPALASNAPLSN